jgi:hypothetical protein
MALVERATALTDAQSQYLLSRNSGDGVRGSAGEARLGHLPRLLPATCGAFS